LLFGGLPGFLFAACAFAQSDVEGPVESVPVLPGPKFPFELTPDDAQPIVVEPLMIDPAANVDTIIQTPCANLLHDFWGYRHETSATSWIVGNGDQFGVFSLESDHYQARGLNKGIGVGLKFHFLAGPARTDMPPRVFDFSLGYQRRERLGDFGYDVAAAVMASSDFEGSSREGIRFPSHAVGYLKVDAMTELVFGAEYLDRGDIKLLPVGGLIVLPHPDVRLDLVFPRPRATFQLTEEHRLFVGGELGGGSWAIERVSLVDDLATYRDLRLRVGLERIKDDGQWSAFEIAYLFDRNLEFSSGNGDYSPVDTVMIRLIQTH